MMNAQLVDDVRMNATSIRISYTKLPSKSTSHESTLPVPPTFPEASAVPLSLHLPRFPLPTLFSLDDISCRLASSISL